MLSYTISNYYFTWLSVENSVYLDWALYDYATVSVLTLLYLFVKKTTPSFLYLITGLMLNSLFSLSIYVDVYVNENKEPWVLWDIYSFSVNIIDLIMIVVLIVDRDLLGLHKLKNKLFGPTHHNLENNVS